MGNKSCKKDPNDSDSSISCCGLKKNKKIIENHQVLRPNYMYNSGPQQKPAQKTNQPIKVYQPKKIYPFVKSQDINKIRQNQANFTDSHFQPSLRVLGQSGSELIKDLCKSLQIPGQNVESLRSKLKWERAKVICYNKRKDIQFVLDERGAPVIDPKASFNGKFFSAGDIFQGDCGDCFFIATIIALVRNKELLGHIIPADNASPANKKAGAYHFRFWKLGDWYDVVGKILQFIKSQ